MHHGQRDEHSTVNQRPACTNELRQRHVDPSMELVEGHFLDVCSFFDHLYPGYGLSRELS